MTHDDPRSHGRLRVPRSRGALTGVLLIALGAWGALVPFLGPLLADYGYAPDDTALTAARFWLQVLPGVVTAVGGLLVLLTANRLVATLGGYVAVAGGAWYVLSPALRGYLPGSSGELGAPLGSDTAATWALLGMFLLLGVVIVLLAGQAVGRVSVRSVRDVEAVHARADAPDEIDLSDRASSTQVT